VQSATSQIVTEGYTWHVLVSSAMKAVSIPPEVRGWLERDPDAYETVV
jgi:acyl-CoA thioesterase FadM